MKVSAMLHFSCSNGRAARFFGGGKVKWFEVGVRCRGEMLPKLPYILAEASYPTRRSYSYGSAHARNQIRVFLVFPAVS